MSSRRLWSKLSQFIIRPASVVALTAMMLVMVGAVEWRRTVAASNKEKATTAAILPAGSNSKIAGVFEGRFDANTKQIQLTNTTSGKIKVSLGARTEASSMLPNASHTKVFNTSCASPSGTKPCISAAPSNTVSGEFTITNTGSSKFYNTRLIFTDFLNAAGGTPVSANAYFNDGQVPANGKLGVSRDFGDINPAGSASRVWTFSFPGSSLQSFYFKYVIYADLGVATESVEPAAVQNTAASSVAIYGQGFNSPTIELLNAAGAVVNTLASSPVSATQVNATIPAATVPGIYSIRVTNAGGTVNGPGSSTLVGRLSVTPAPNAAHTGTFTSFSDAGPYLVNANSTVSGTVPAGAVVYVANGVTLTVGSGLVADGGVPGVPTTNPNQIVFTRTPGGVSWGGIDATSATGDVTLKNCVVEFGGGAGSAAVNINSASGAGKTLKFADSIARRSGGAGIRVVGADDRFTGFARSRIENNAGAALLLSANASLGAGSSGSGMGDIDGANSKTSVPDQSYFYSTANVIAGNGFNAVQIDAAVNDFTRSGFLIGQGAIPIQILGSSGNPATVGNPTGPTGAELTIGPAAIIQLAGGTDLKAGDGALFGNIAANGFAGINLSPDGNAALSQRISFNSIDSSKWGSLYFSSKSAGTSILNFVSVQNGGSSTLGTAQVVVDNISYPFKFTNSQSNNSATSGLQFLSSSSIDRSGSTYSTNGAVNENVISSTPFITTIAGGVYGDGNMANTAPLVNPAAMAVDPGRGVYILDKLISGDASIRFANTSGVDQKIAGITVPAKTIKRITAGLYFGIYPGSNTPMDTVDLLTVKAIALSPNKNVLYFNSFEGGSRFISGINVTPGANTGASPVVIGTTSVDVGNIGTLYSDPGSTLSDPDSMRGMAVNPVTGDIYLADQAKYKVVKISTTGAISDFAGSGTVGKPTSNGTWPAFPSSTSVGATSFFMFAPEAITVSNDGNYVYISDSRYSRVMRIDRVASTATLVTQLGSFNAGAFEFTNSPMPAGLALVGDTLYIAQNGTTLGTLGQTVVKVDNANTVTGAQTVPSGVSTTVPTVTLVAGASGIHCDFTAGNCGDGGTLSSNAFDLTTMNINLLADANGLYLADQGFSKRGRIRYLNTSGSAVTIGNVTIPSGNATTVIGSGLADPYDGGMATSAIFSNTPVGVTTDSNGNLYIAEASGQSNSNGSLRFVNRTGSTLNIYGQSVAPGNIIRVNNAVDSTMTMPESTDPRTSFFNSIQAVKSNANGIFILDSVGLQIPAGSTGLKTSKLRFLNTSGAAVTFYAGSATPISVNPGEIKTIAGTGTDPSSIGDNSSATFAKLLGTTDFAVHPTTGDIYLSEPFISTDTQHQKTIRKINGSTGIITSPNILTATNKYTGLTFDNSKRLVLCSYTSDQIVRESGDSTGSFAVLSVSGVTIKGPRGVAVDPQNNLYVVNGFLGTSVTASFSQILKLTDSGAGTVLVSTSNAPAFLGDGGLPAAAKMDTTINPVTFSVATGASASTFIQATGITISPSGEVIFADSKNGRIRRVK
jgi:hypothetical protein